MNNDNEMLRMLIKKIHSGDNQAMALIIDMLYPGLYRKTYQYLQDIMLAADVAFESIYKLISSNIKDIRNISGWVTVTAKNRCLDIIKKRKREIYKEEILMSISDNANADYIEKHHIEQCLANLSESERKMLLLKYHGYTMIESIKLMRTTMAKGRRLLKKAQENFKKKYQE